MSPDLEWRIDDQAGEQTIAKPAPPHPPRWRPWVVMLMVMLGVGLGVAYRSLPEPPPPTPTPTPTVAVTQPALPAALFQTIERETQALADGDRISFEKLLDTSYSEWRQTLLANFGAWGRPAHGPLYSILDFGLLADDVAWVDVRQFRTGRTFHQTRFYRLRNGHWLHTDSDPRFWKGEFEASDTAHFHVIYAVEDLDWVPPLITQFEQDYEQICTDLGCPTGPQYCVESLDRQWCSTFSPEITFTLSLNNGVGRPYTSGDIELPSPRVLGEYDRANPISYNDAREAAVVPWVLAYRLIYGTANSTAQPSGEPLAWAVSVRELNRLQQRAGYQPIELFGSEAINVHELPSLASLWENFESTDTRLTAFTAYQLIKFLEEEYGPESIAKLAKTIAKAKSTSDAIETSLGVPFADFEQQWLEWLRPDTLK
jgi:hypothetical protein